MKPQEAAATYLSLTGADAVQFAQLYEGELCASDEDFDTYLDLIGMR